MINVEHGSKNVLSKKGNNTKLAGNYDQGANFKWSICIFRASMMMMIGMLITPLKAIVALNISLVDPSSLCSTTIFWQQYFAQQYFGGTNL